MSSNWETHKKTDLLAQAIERRTSKLNQVTNTSSDSDFGLSIGERTLRQTTNLAQQLPARRESTTSDKAWVNDVELLEGGALNTLKNMSGIVFDKAREIPSWVATGFGTTQIQSNEMFKTMDNEAANQLLSVDRFNELQGQLSQEYGRINLLETRGSLTPFQAEEARERIRTLVAEIPAPVVDQDLINDRPVIQREVKPSLLGMPDTATLLKQTPMSNREMFERGKDLMDYTTRAYDFWEKRGNQSGIERAQETAETNTVAATQSFINAAEAWEKAELVESVFEGAKGLAQFAGGYAKTLAEHPGAASAMAADLLFDVLAFKAFGVGGLVAASDAQMRNHTNNLLQEYIEQNGIPDREALENIELNHLINVGLNMGGAVGITKAITPAGFGSGLANLKNTAATAIGATRAGNLLNQSRTAIQGLANTNTLTRGVSGAATVTGRAAKAVGTGAAIEGFEGILAETSNQTLGKGRRDFEEANLNEILAAGVLEGLGGGLVTGGAELLSGTGTAVGNTLNRASNSIGSKIDTNTRVNKDAVESGNIQEVSELQGEAFDATEYMNTIRARNARNDVSVEEKMDNVRKAQEAYARLTEEGLVAQQSIEIFNEELAKDTLSDEVRAKYTDRKNQYVQTLERVTKDLTDHQVTLEEIRGTITGRDAENIVQSLETANQSGDAGIQAQQVIEAIRTNPSAFNTALLNRIIGSGAQFNDAQLQYLESLKESGTALDSLKQVSLDAFEGNEVAGFKGIATYERELAQADMTNNNARRERVLGQLNNFVQSQTQKAQDFRAAADAWFKANRANQPITAEEQAAIDYVESTYKDKDGKAYEVGARFEKMTTAVETETAALQAFQARVLNESNVRQPINDRLNIRVPTREEILTEPETPQNSSTASNTESSNNVTDTVENTSESVSEASSTSVNENITNSSNSTNNEPQNITPEIQAKAQKIARFENEIKAIEETIDKLGGKPTEKQLNAINKYSNGIKKLKDELESNGTPYSFLEAEANKAINKESIQKDIESLLKKNNPKSLSVDMVYDSKGNVIRSYDPSKNLKDVSYVGYKKEGEYLLVDTNSLEVVKRVNSKVGINRDDAKNTILGLDTNQSQQPTDVGEASNTAETVTPTSEAEASVEVDAVNTEEQVTVEASPEQVDESEVDIEGLIDSLLFDLSEDADVEARPNTLFNNLISNLNPRIQNMLKARSNKTRNPLVSYPNFMRLEGSAFIDKAIEYLYGTGSTKELTIPQITALTKLQEVHKQVFKFTENFLQDANEKSINQPSIYKQSFIERLLRNEDGSLNDNAVAALSIGIYDWISSSAEGTLINTADDIRGILGLTDADVVPNSVINHMYDKGVPTGAIVNAIGSVALNSLHLSTNKETTPEDLITKIKGELGLFGLHALTSADTKEGGLAILAENTIDTQPIKDGISKEGFSVKAETMTLYRVRTDVEATQEDKYSATPISHAQRIIDSVKGSEGVVAKLFGSGTRRVEPSFSKPKKAPSKMRGTNQTVPEAVQEVLLKDSQRPWTTYNEISDRLSGLTEATRLYLFGYRENEEEISMVDDIPSVRGRNLAAKRSYENHVDLQNQLKSQSKNSFYHTYFMARQFRSHIASNVSNPQADKNHRFLYVKKGWQQTFDMNPADESGMRNRFMLALAEGFGIGRDKLENTETLDRVWEKINSQEIQDGIKAIRTLDELGENVTPENQAIYEKQIIKAVDYLDNGMHGYAALVEYSRFAEAQRTNASTFTTAMISETDGVTNGLMLGRIFFAGESTAEALAKSQEKGGFFTDGTEDLVKWKRKKNGDDAYEETSKGVDNLLQDILANAASDVEKDTATRILRNFGKNISFTVDPDNGDMIVKVEREMGKGPTMTIGYGAGQAAIAKSVVHLFYDSIRKELHKAGMKDDINKANDIIEDFNQLSGGKGPQIPWVNESADIFRTRVPENNYTVASKVESLIGVPLAETAASNHAEFIKNRGFYNQIIDVVNNIYITLVEDAVKAKEAELRSLPDTDPRKLYENESLPRGEMQSILDQYSDILPAAHTLFSKESGNLSEAIFLGKDEKIIKEGVTNAVGIKKGKTKIVNNGESTVTGAKNRLYADISAKGFSRNLGVRAAIMTIQGAGDATIALRALDKHDLLSIFDGFGAKAGDELNVAATLNEATLEALQNSPLQNAFDLLIKSVEKIANEKGTASKKEVLGYFGKSRLVPKGTSQVAQVLASIQSEVNRIEGIKKEYLEQHLSHINQYYQEGGAFQVSEPRQVTESESKATQETIDRVLPPKVEKSDARYSPFGKLANTPKTPINELMVKVFGSNNEADPVQLMRAVWSSLKGNTDFEKAQKEILRGISSSATLRKVKVIKIPSTADLNDLDAFGGSEVVRDFMTTGEYRAVHHNGTIFIKGEGFLNHGLTTETFVHELIHALSAAELTAPTTTESKNAKRKLENILKTVETKLATDEAFNNEYGQILKPILEAGNENQTVADRNLSKLHELVAWGTTNKDVQRALANVEVTNNNTNRTLSDAFKEMVNAIAGLLFKGMNNKQVKTNALYQLINNTAAVINVQSDVDSSNDIQPQVSPEDGINDRVSNLTATEMFMELGKLSDQSRDDLLEVVQDLQANVPYSDVRSENVRKGIFDTTDAYLNAIQERSVPFINAAHANGFNLTDQESFVLDQIQLTSEAVTNSHSKVRKDLDALYDRARSELTVEAFIGANEDPTDPDVKEAAQRRYDYVFNPTTTETVTEASDIALTGTRTSQRSNYLARFVGLAMVYKPLNNALANINAETNQEENVPLSEKLRKVLNRIVNLVGNWSIGYKTNDTINNRMKLLVPKLAQANVRHASKISQGITNKSNRLEAMGDNVIKGAVGKLDRGLKKLALTTRSPGVHKYATLASKITSNEVEEVITNMSRVYQNSTSTRQGLFGSLVTELMGQTDGNKRFHELLVKVKNIIDQQRRHVDEYTKEFASTQMSREMSVDEKRSATQVLMETDLQTLLGDYSISEIMEAISNANKVKAMIEREKSLLTEIPLDAVQEVVNHAHYLGYFMATGNTAFKQLALNAEMIVNKGESTSNLNTRDRKRLIAAADRLASLYALKYTSVKAKLDINDLMIAEGARTDGINGFENLMLFHRSLVEKAKETNFSGNGALMRKGHISEIQDTRVQIKFTEGKITKEEREDLIRRGYVQVTDKLRIDPDIQNDVRAMWVSEGDGLPAYMANIVSFTSEKRKGSDAGYMTQKEVQFLNNIKQKELKKLGKIGDVDPTQTKERYAVPVRNEQGDVVGYRYVMNRAMRHNLLKRETDITKVMGKMAGDVISKGESKKLNREFVEALRMQYADDLANGYTNFVKVGNQTSNDKKLDELYKMFPADMQQAIREVWGVDQIMIRRDLETLAFGYRKFSFAEYWDIPEEDRRWYQKLIIGAAEQTFGKFGNRAALSKIRTGEEFIQTLVREIKDILVVKTGLTLLGNTISNASVLYVHGVPLREIVNGQMEAYNAVTKYQLDQRKISELENSLNVENTKANPNANTIKRLESDLAILRDKVATNPISEMIDAGVFQSIVEDIDVDEDQFSIRETISDKIDKYTAKVPSGIKNVTREFLITNQSKTYKILNHLTQTSDLMSRYVLFNHMVNQENKSKPEAISYVREVFVNYDLPTHRFIQWANDHGLLMFTKYYLRVPKVLFKMMAQYPARMLMLYGLQNVFDFPNIHDSWLTPDKIGSRFQNPLVNVFTAPGEILTINALDGNL